MTTIEFLQNKINKSHKIYFYNDFIKNITLCDWSAIMPNKRYEFLEKNRSDFYNSEPIKKNENILNLCARINFICSKIKNNGGILTNINPELVSCVCNENFIKNAIEFLSEHFNASLQVNFHRNNNKTDYTIIKCKKSYYFVFVKNFVVESFNEIKIDKDTRDQYMEFLFCKTPLFI